MAVDSSPIEVRLVRTSDEYAMVMAVRAAVFLGEEDNITYFDEFNGNDYVASHLLALVNGDPAGVIRVRWFANFALLERIAIRRRYRSYPPLAALARAAFELCRQKGYRRVAGRARLETAKFWRRFGASQSGPPIEHFRGRMIPMIRDLAPSNTGTVPFGPFGDPEFESLITQVEGKWRFSEQMPMHLAAAE